MKRLKTKHIIWGAIIFMVTLILATFIINWEDTKAGIKDGMNAGSKPMEMK